MWKKKRSMNQKGMTMVEIIVAFAILLIGMSMLYKATTFSLLQIQKADEIQQKVDELMNGYYLSQGTQVKGELHHARYLIDGKEIGGLSFYTGDYEQDEYHIYSFFAEEEEAGK